MAMDGMVEATQTNDAPSSRSGYLTPSSAEQQWTPETVLSALPSRPPSHSTSPIPFFHLLERLKTTKREGWRRFNITHGESISDHMYRMSIITMLCPPLLAQKLDIARCIRMALVHDMAESLVGDITPVDGVSKSEKSRREAATMDYLCQSLLGNVHTDSEQAKAIRDAWQEYEDSVTPESHFVHDVDKIELLLQMNEYERAQQGKVDLGEFSRVAKRIALPEVRVWAEELLREREQFWREQCRDASHVGISDEIKRQQDEYYRGAGKDGEGLNGHV